jgi:tRNA/tmRNA/rRNA uracil-C5-methylase (TrmA/RlmC/RlmD family)
VAHPAPDDLIELEVGPVAPGGSCVARHDGRVVFVRHALPGERVHARVTARGSRFWRADAVEVLVASPDRVAAPCPYAGPGRCGGCDWQHVTPERQRLLKAGVLHEQLRRIGGVDLAAAGLAVTVSALPSASALPSTLPATSALPATSPASSPACPDTLGWRTRVQFAVLRNGVVGLHRHRSSQVEPVDRCLIAHPDVERIGVQALRWPGAEVVEAVAAPSTDQRLVVVTPARGRRVRIPTPVDAAVAVAGAPAGKAPAVHHEVAGRRFRVSAGGFWQVHPAAAQVLAATVLELAASRPGERVLDLYAGAGLFAATMAAPVGVAGRVVAVDSDAVAVADARANLADLPQVRVVRARLTPATVAGPPVAPALGARPDVVVADPPRSGLGTALTQALLRLGPRALVYVACDGAALARDLKAATEAGYRLAALRAFDLFPMTAHVECVALLSAGPS